MNIGRASAKLMESTCRKAAKLSEVSFPGTYSPIGHLCVLDSPNGPFEEGHKMGKSFNCDIQSIDMLAPCKCSLFDPFLSSWVPSQIRSVA